MAVIVVTVFTIAAIGSLCYRDFKMFWFYLLSAAINIVVVL